jgi:hypothetical protein
MKFLISQSGIPINKLGDSFLESDIEIVLQAAEIDGAHPSDDTKRNVRWVTIKGKKYYKVNYLKGDYLLVDLDGVAYIFEDSKLTAKHQFTNLDFIPAWYDSGGSKTNQPLDKWGLEAKMRLSRKRDDPEAYEVFLRKEREDEENQKRLKRFNEYQEDLRKESIPFTVEEETFSLLVEAKDGSIIKSTLVDYGWGISPIRGRYLDEAFRLTLSYWRNYYLNTYLDKNLNNIWVHNSWWLQYLPYWIENKEKELVISLLAGDEDRQKKLKELGLTQYLEEV